MNNYPHPIIAREGWPFLAITFAAALLASQYLGAWSIPFWIIAVFVLQFFRDPARVIPVDPKAVLSPADGRIVVVEKTMDPYANREALKISVFMNVFNVHSNRSPVDGKIEKVYSTMCLLEQAYIKNPDQTITDFVKSKIAEMGENIQIRRFVRYAVGEEVSGS